LPRIPWYHRPEYHTGNTQQWYRITPCGNNDHMMFSIYKAVVAQGFVGRYNHLTGIVWARKRSDRDMSILLLLIGNNTITEHTKLI